MSNPFITGTSFVSPSLNRVRVRKLPGNQFADRLRGQNGYNLLSSASLRAMIANQAPRLGLKESSKDLLRALNNCFSSQSREVRQIAREIADAYGRRLALLILTLKQALPENRQARASWKRQHWQFWQQVTAIHIGGGLVAGSMGPLAVQSAKKVLRQCGCAEIDIQLSPLAAKLPLAGLARTAPPDTVAMLVLDFGNTSIKRAVAHYQSAGGCWLQSLADLPAPIELYPPVDLAEKQVKELSSQVVSIVTRSYREATDQSWSLSPAVGMSLACYLMNGQPPPQETGQYGILQFLSPNLQEFLSERISAELDSNARINLIHDGTAAGLVYAGAEHTIALMLGTALGIGFPPPTDRGLRKITILNANGGRSWTPADLCSL